MCGKLKFAAHVNFHVLSLPPSDSRNFYAAPDSDHLYSGHPICDTERRNGGLYEIKKQERLRKIMRNIKKLAEMPAARDMDGIRELFNTDLHCVTAKIPEPRCVK